MIGVDRSQAQSPTTWTAGTGNFTNDANWSNGAPTLWEWFINNGGTARLSSDDFTDNGFLGYGPAALGLLAFALTRAGLLPGLMDVR